VVTLSESPFTIVDPRKNLPADGVYAIVTDWDYVKAKFLPAGWKTHQDISTPSEVRYLAFVAERENRVLMGNWCVGSAMNLSPRPMSPQHIAEEQGMAVTIVPARAVDYNPSRGLPGDGLVVAAWYPDQHRVGLDPSPLMAVFDQHSVAYLRRPIRLQANFDYYVRPGAFEMIAETTLERQQLTRLLEKCVGRFGGRVIIYYSANE
jgi:hypothetical protein